MSPAVAGGFSRKRFLYPLLCYIAFFVFIGPAIGEEEKEVMFSFSLPADEVIKYKTSTQIEQNFFGIDITINQSSDVDMSLDKKTEEGNYKVLFSFKGTKASRIIDDEIMDWTPPLQLEGKTIYAIVSPKGEVVNVEPGGFIPGMRKVEDLKKVVDPWFINMPDTVVKIGESWTEEIMEQGNNEEDEGPELRGKIFYKLKKIEEKKGIEVAVVEAKIKAKIHSVTPAGMIDAEGNGDVKAYVAIEGGYIVEAKRRFDIKGKMVGDDPLTGGEKETDTAMSQHMEIKLEK